MLPTGASDWSVGSSCVTCNAQAMLLPADTDWIPGEESFACKIISLLSVDSTVQSLQCRLSE